MNTPSLFSSHRKNVAFSLFLEKIDFSISEKTKGYQTFEKAELGCDYNSMFDEREVFLDCVCKFVFDNQFDHNIHIEDAFYYLEELVYLIQKGVKVDVIFILSEKNRMITRNKGIEEYRTHSRWIDIPPKRIIKTYTDFEEKIQKLRKYCIEQDIKIVEI
ncbi:hypothetical protein [Bernardetia sp.]|uniref:hypothetical protein n=1 Tax=Bernardetia sp. TaxID=1937974 RepID=UPI0025BFDAE0|nr:hypothetical protein [Bernardetia sp.]